MTEGAHHPRESLHELIDGLLDAGARAGVEAHVQDCASCRRELDLLQATRRRVARAFADAGGAEALDALERRARASLDEEDRARADARGEGPGRDRRTAPAVGPARFGPLAAFLRRNLRPVAALAAAVLVVAVAATFMISRSPDVPASVASGYGAVRSGTLALDRRTGDTNALEAYFAERLAFKPHVFDFGMMRYRLVGGVVHDVGGRPGSLALYEGPEGRTIACEMYEGRLRELPPPKAVQERGGVVFRIYERGGRTLVFWQDGPIVCVLTSDIPMDEVLQLAFAKAVKV